MTRIRLVSLLALCLLGAAPAGAGPEDRPMPPHLGRARIGIQVQPMTPELREHMEAPKDAGVLVMRVEEGSPAADAGVRVGDVVTHAGGEPLASPHDLIVRVLSVPEGETLALELVRDGKTVKLDVAPAGPTAPEPGGFERGTPGGFHHGMDALERRLDALERRLQELEGRLPPQKPT
jgi:S1-C subfamily serine protease